MKSLLYCAIFLVFSTEIVFAQSETFNVRVFIGSDNISPSTPTLLSVTPIAQTQIDVSWSAATDNYVVAGYLVLRDGLPVATTTLLSYSDTSLAASTTYSYVIRAFDVALNYSSTSNSLATTTLQIPPTPAPTATAGLESSTEGTATRVVIKEIRVDAGISTTSIFVNTAYPSNLEIRWGRTASYELGYTVSNGYSNNHRTLLTDLEPATKYEYEIIGKTPHGSESVVHSGSFITSSNSVSVSPVNVSRFQAVGNGQDVDLSWQLPKEDSLAYVRIVRSHLGFPEHPQDGAIVYQGLGSFVKDIDILNSYSPVYYTAFVYDVFGNVSSGAVAIVYAFSAEKPRESSPIKSSELPIIAEEATSSVNKERVTVSMKMPQSSEILIRQRDQEYSLFDKDIILDSEQVFFLSIPSSAIAGNLKSIIATIIDPTDNRKAYSFLLRINKDQTAYEATVAALGVIGRSQITVEIYDYEAFVVATYKTPVTFALVSEVNNSVVFPDAAYRLSKIILPVTTSLFIVLLLFLLVYRLRG